MSGTIFELRKEFSVRAMRALARPELNEAENHRAFGKRARLHGHDFKVRVHLLGGMETRSGQVFERERLERILNLAVVEPLEGRNLNEFFPNTSNEGLARALYLRLKPLFPDGMLTQVGISTADGAAAFPAL